MIEATWRERCSEAPLLAGGVVVSGGGTWGALDQRPVSFSANCILQFAEPVLTMTLAISRYHLFPLYRQETEDQAMEASPGSSVNRGRRLISQTLNILPCTLLLPPLPGGPHLVKRRRIGRSLYHHPHSTRC